MPQNPNSISVKDRLYISDILSATLTAAKKVMHYTSVAQDKEVSDQLNSLVSTLTYQYDDLVSLLEE